MATGLAWPNGGNVALWHLNYKINAPDRGFNIGFKVANVVEAVAKATGLKIAGYLKALMTSDSEIFYASMSRDDHLRDSRYLASAIGSGTFEPVVGITPAGQVNAPRDAALFRLESADGTAVTMKFAPMPDSQVLGNNFKVAPAAVVGVPGTMPADADITAAWEVNFNKFMAVLVFGTHHVQGGHLPGGAYEFDTWINCYPLRIGSKKGGRVFI